MTKPTFLAAGLVGALLAIAPAAAQTGPAMPAQPPMPGYTDEDTAAVLDARVIALKTVLKLTPEQEKLWPPVEASIRDAVKGSMARREARAASLLPSSALDLLEQMADAEEARAQSVKAFVAAAKPFVASLTPQQLNRLPAFLGLYDGGGAAPSSMQLWMFEDEQ